MLFSRGVLAQLSAEQLLCSDLTFMFFNQTSELDVAYPLSSLPITEWCHEAALRFHCGNSCTSVTNEGIL